ncbi:MAG: hypothetical protein FJ034_07575 [Chloroflexi bacterium]|nr:hypothetical protein [Chloroflexota bacterium]
MQIRRLIPAAALAVLVAACAPPARTLEVEMRDLAFAPDTITLTRGERILIRFRNTAAVQHEFMAGRDPRSDGGYKNDLFQGVQVRVQGGAHGDGHAESHGGFGLVLGAGRNGGIEFTVPDRPGKYEIGCFEPGHYDAGMRGRLVVR